MWRATRGEFCQTFFKGHRLGHRLVGPSALATAGLSPITRGKLEIARRVPGTEKGIRS